MSSPILNCSFSFETCQIVFVEKTSANNTNERQQRRQQQQKKSGGERQKGPNEKRALPGPETARAPGALCRGGVEGLFYPPTPTPALPRGNFLQINYSCFFLTKRCRLFVKVFSSFTPDNSNPKGNPPPGVLPNFF